MTGVWLRAFVSVKFRTASSGDGQTDRQADRQADRQGEGLVWGFRTLTSGGSGGAGGSWKRKERNETKKIICFSHIIFGGLKIGYNYEPGPPKEK